MLKLLKRIKDLKQEVKEMRERDHRGYQVCYDCGRLTHQFTFLETEKGGKDRPFCDDCAGWCSRCQVDFAPMMYSKHKDCGSFSEDESSEEEVDG